MTSTAPQIEATSSVAWLQAALARLDILLHRQLQRYSQSRVHESENGPLQKYYVTEDQAYSLLYQGPGHRAPELPAADVDDYVQALDSLERRLEAIAADASAAGVRIPFVHLAECMELSAFERDVLLVALAPELDARYGRIYGYLNDDPALELATVDLVLDLLTSPGLGRLALLRHMGPQAALVQRHLIELAPFGPTASRLRTTIRPDSGITAWLSGEYAPSQALHGHLLLEPERDASLWLLSADLQQQLADAARSNDLVVLHGRDQLAQRSALDLLAALADRPLLVLDVESATRAGLPFALAVEHTLRDALLIDAIPVFSGWDQAPLREALTRTLVEELVTYPNLLVLTGARRWQPRLVARDRRLRMIALPVPDSHDRRAFVESFLADAGVDADAVGDLTTLTGQFSLTGEQWRDVVYAALDSAAQAGAALNMEDLYAAARDVSSPGLAGLGSKIEPRFDWEDLVLPPEPTAILHEIVETVRRKAFVLEEWGLGASLVSSAGTTILFSGPPGTGKTMAAEVLARQLGLDLYKIDLSGVISKYIGETEKNLERVFAEAEDSNAILFFDEADAIFGKRSEVSDAHDRHANIEISYLLQRMETYNGVTILATNLRGNLDEAFFRRLHFVVDLPFPDSIDRLRIWQALFPAGVPVEDDIDLELMARRFKFAGGNIRNVLVSAAHLAASQGSGVSMAHLMHGARREMQKMGRMISDDTFAL